MIWELKPSGTESGVAKGNYCSEGVDIVETLQLKYRAALVTLNSSTKSCAKRSKILPAPQPGGSEPVPKSGIDDNLCCGPQGDEVRLLPGGSPVEHLYFQPLVSIHSPDRVPESMQSSFRILEFVQRSWLTQ